MQKADKDSASVRRQREQLGKKIKKLRESRDFSMRQFALQIGIPASNLKYIEDGVNVPTAQVYGKIVELLNPGEKARNNLDKLYSSLRGSPPPDVCEIIIRTEGMNDALRILDEITLTPDQLQELKKTLLSFRPPDRGGGERVQHE